MRKIWGIVFAIFVSLAFAAEEHGTVFPITETAAVYNANDNYFESTNPDRVRFSYKPSKSGSCTVTSSYESSSFSRYLYYYGTNNSFSSTVNNASGYSPSVSFYCDAGETYYFEVYVYNTSYYSYNFNIKGAVEDISIVTVQGKTLPDTVITGKSLSISASVPTGQRFLGWKIETGTGSLAKANSPTTTFSPTSKMATLSYATEAASMYSITTTVTSYSAAQHFYSVPYGEIRLFFVAPSDGGYIINVARPSTDRYYVYRYSNGSFSSYSAYATPIADWADTLKLSKGDSIFYKLENYYTSDSLELFKVSYVKTDVYTVTIESESSHCAPSPTTLEVVKGQSAFFEASGDLGYRPNGWKFVSGSHKFGDSTTYTLRDTILSNTKIKLLCREAKLIDVSEKVQKFTPKNDFYEVSPANGMRFRYVAPTTDLYILRTQPTDFYGTYRYYGTDDSFTTPIKTVSNSRASSYVYVKPASKNETTYLRVDPYSSSYYGDEVSVFVEKASIVTIDGGSPDTVSMGQTMNLSKTLSRGEHFAGWKINSGTGSFSDKNDRAATFIPTSAVVKLSSKTTTLPIYELTNKYKGFSYTDNSCQSGYYSYYGIRSSYKATDSALYALVYRTARNTTVYRFRDSLFNPSSYTGSTSCSSSGTVMECKMLLTLNADSMAYFLMVPSGDATADSVYAKVLKTVKVNADMVGDGYVYVGTSSRNYDSTYVSGDSVPMRAYVSSSLSRFKYWQKVSGSCKIVDSTKASTYAVVSGNCRVKAVFGTGSVYTITKTSTEYTTAEHYYSGNVGSAVRFKFVAPSAGTYAFVFSRAKKTSSYVYRYDSSDFYSTTNSLSGYDIIVDSLKLAKGDSVFYEFQNSYTSDSEVPFWVSYSTSRASIALEGGKNGVAIPTGGYPKAWANVGYPIDAMGKAGYRFYRWKVVSGNGTLADSKSKMTTVSAKDTITVKASFKAGESYELTETKTKYNFRENYYSDSTYSMIRFVWYPPDTNAYLLTITHVDTLSAQIANFGRDSTYKTAGKRYTVESDTSVIVQGIPGIPVYLGIEDSRTSEYPDKSFAVQIRKPYVMFVESNQGRAIPSGNVYLEPGKDTTVTVSPYGGFVFDSWTLVEGKAKIENPSNVKTKVVPQSEYCHIKANYVLDFTVDPSIEITGLDLSNHPGVCAEVSVTDENTGRPIYGLDSTNFILFQDNKSLPIQVTSIQDFGGVAVALVVDESGSMGSQDIADVKTAVRAFIDAMGPSDRTTLIGFETSARIIQPMTSDKSLLYAATNQIHSGGGTAITNGAYAALEELANEAGSTTVIIFSDGYGPGDYSTEEIVEKAFWQNTVIHSVGIGSGASQEPLKGIAEGSGGTFAVAPSATELADIYASIQSSVQAKYILCYQSPDTVLNGDTHEVIVKTDFVNKNDVDTAYWSEDYLPPQVKLTKETWKKVGVTQKQKDSIEITVYVTSKVPVVSTRIYIQKSNTYRQSFVSYEMEHVKDSLWRYVLPASSAVAPGIDFYVMATDSLALIGKAPLISNPAREPYSIPIKNDVPAIEFAGVECIDTTGGTGYLAFYITDDDGIYKSSLYYKDSLAVLFREAPMSRSTEDVWVAEVPAESFSASSLEYYVRAMDADGSSVRYDKKSNHKIEACKDGYKVPDVEDEIKIVSMDEEDISRNTPYIGLTLKTQDFSFRVDTARVKLSCLVSGDIENNIKLVETKSGFFMKDSIPKNEKSAKRDNGTISCAPIDTLVAEYKDPAYKTVVYDTVIIHDMISVSYQFIEVKSDDDLDSVETTINAPFRIRVTAESKSVSKVDTLKLLLFTDQGDSLWVKAIETGKYSSVFEYVGKFYFVEDSTLLKDSQLDAVFDLDTTYNRVKIQAQIAGDSSELDTRDSLIVFSNYVPADIAEIYDADLDGHADSIRIHFKKKLESMVAGVDTVYWNAAGGEWRKVPKKQLKMGDDDYWIEAKLKDEFEYGATAADSANPPYLRVKKTEDDFSQKVKLVDHVGAVPAKAEKRPGSLSMMEFMDPKAEVPPDTIVVTLSEPIHKVKKAKNDEWKKLFYHSGDCEETKESPMNLAKEPMVDSTGLVWTLILADYNMVVGNCIRTNPKAAYEDSSKNSMGHGGVEVEGDDGDRYLYEVTPVPFVSGMDKGAKWIPPKGDSWVKVPDTLSTIKVASIAPYKAYITIFDGYSNVVASFKQSFGYDGEMKQKIRGNDMDRSKIGFLYWDQRTNEGRKVGTGVFIWHIDFKFNDGHTEYRLLKTGIKRKK